MNKGHWLSQLLESYKKEPATDTKLRERNSKWLNDDYVKFVRYAQHFIDKTGYGVLGYITNHGFIDNPTFRGMRWSLLKSFNKIFIIDLHGNSNIVEAVPEGSGNENVFDIKQGVAITIAVRSKPMGKNEVASVKHTDVYGTREEKYAFLEENKLSTINFQDVVLREPFYYFENKSYRYVKEYSKWPSIGDIYKAYSTGYYTSCDDIVIGDSVEDLRTRVDGSGLNLTFDVAKVRKTVFRPFDIKYVYYDVKLLTRARAKFVARLPEDNVFIITGKSTKNHSADHFYIGDVFPELKCGESSKGSYMFPLWINEKPQGSGFLPDESNINSKVLERYEEIVGAEATPFRVHMYIYAVMYSPSYRTVFNENIREDFIHIPYPTNAQSFAELSAHGETLFRLHTLIHPALEQLVTSFPAEGSNRLTLSTGKDDWKVDEDKGTVRVWINDEQYFDEVPVEAWELSVGGYFPAQKWLKDRKGRELSFHEIMDYQRVIVALAETVRIMGDIDVVMAGLLDGMDHSDTGAKA
jgi:predicted helicase